MQKSIKKEKPKNFSTILFSLCFCCIILSGFVAMIYDIQNQISEIVITENKLSNFSLKSIITDVSIFEDKLKPINSMLQKNVLQKKEIDDFKYYKNIDGGYIITRSPKSVETIKSQQQNIKALYDSATQNGADFLYISMPSRVNDTYREILSNIDFSNDYKDMLLSGIHSDIPTLDLRKISEIESLESSYYKTDHHWNVESIFLAFKATIAELNTLYELSLDSQKIYTNLDNYEILVSQNTFSGSTRQNVGEIYLEKEDFKLYSPIYPTGFVYEHYINGELDKEKHGDFQEALCNMEIFENDKYLNKYNVFLGGGYVENRIYNELSDNNKKLLLISSSYGRPFAPYISQCFSEVIFLDPQNGRYTDNMIDYIDQYNPDVVLVLHDDYVSANVTK